MLIFYTTAENPVPLETDEALRLEATHKAMKRSWLSVHVVLGVLFLLNIIFYVSALRCGAGLCLHSSWFLSAMAEKIPCGCRKRRFLPACEPKCTAVSENLLSS